MLKLTSASLSLTSLAAYWKKSPLFNFFPKQVLFVLYLKRRRKEKMSATFLEIILAIILPPLGVFLRYECRVEFWICVLLTIFGWLPGIIYAIYILTKRTTPFS